MLYALCKKGAKMADKIRCSQGHKNQVGNNFCVFCGESLSGKESLSQGWGLVKCPCCGVMISWNGTESLTCECGKPIVVVSRADGRK